MTERVELWTGGWWRFTKYEVRGEHIGPATDASLEWYDPWDLYHRSQVDAAVLPPYQPLVRLGAELRAARARPEDWPGLIVNWCNQFGLLGIVPHRAIRIDLPVRLLAGVKYPVHVIRSHTRAGGKWVSSRSASRISHAFLEKNPASVEALAHMADEIQTMISTRPDHEEFVLRLTTMQSKLSDVPLEDVDTVRAAESDENWPLGTFAPPNDPEYYEPSIVFDSDIRLLRTGSNVSSSPVTGILPDYFPQFSGEPNTFECPRPLSQEFWWQYHEPIQDLRSYATAFYFGAGCGKNEPILRSLEALIQPAGISLSRAPGNRIQERWVCPSLLSSFARMLLQDHAAGKRMLRCECCGNPFVTDNYQARYCAPKCGYKTRQRRLRAKASTASPTESQNGKETRK